VPPGPVHDESVALDPANLVGTYEMVGVRLDITAEGDRLLARLGEASPIDGKIKTADPSPLLPVSPTRFVPTDPAIDGSRGWALAFINAETGPATHLLNGVFAMRRMP